VQFCNQLNSNKILGAEEGSRRIEKRVMIPMGKNQLGALILPRFAP
jgi:hypothetical protein